MRIVLISMICILFSSCYGEEGKEEAVFESNSIVVVDPTLQSNMVLQQNSSFCISGKGTPDEKVRAQCSWDDADVFHVAEVEADGRWKIEIRTPEATKVSQTISIQGRSTSKFTNILVGEVWLCAGQSNMYWLLKDAENGAEEVSKALYPHIRLLNMDRTTADSVVDNISAEWKVCTPDNAQWFSAVGYFFGRKLLADLDVPIGLIGANWGNTGAEVWTKRSLLMNDPALAAEVLRKEETPHSDGSPHKAGTTYNTMIYPLRNIPVAGVIWYQGENNQDQPYLYPRLLETMVQGWRDDWGKQFPFYLAQICPYKRDWNYLTNYSNPAIRFMQAQASLLIPNSGIEVNDDIADIHNIHPKNKQDVGLRLAWLALSQTYNRNEYNRQRCPVYDSFEVRGSELTVHFKYADTGWVTTDSEMPSRFEIAGADRVFYAANATVVENDIVLSSPAVANPVAARMGWSYTKITNLRTSAGLPVSVFRTYDWDDETEEP